MDEYIISIFYELDSFFKELNSYFKHYMLPCEKKRISLEPSRLMSLSEIMTICVCFHMSGYRNFKWYYNRFISVAYKKFFPKLVSYNRFVELMPHVAIPLTLFMKIYRVGACTGISFMDSSYI